MSHKMNHKWWIVLMAAMLFILPGCGGAKKSCKKSAEAYFDYLSGNSWGSIYNMLTKEHQKTIGSKKRLAFLMEEVFEYKGSKKFKLKSLAAYPGKDSCNVQIVYDYAVRLRGQNEKPYKGISETLIFKRSPEDKKWYLEIPGASELSGF